jgi:hypothetical protein
MTLMLSSAGCSKKSTTTKVEYVVDTLKVVVPERTETLTVFTGISGIKDTIIVQRDTVEKVTVRFIKIKDTIRIDCECDSMVVSKVDTITYVTTKQVIVEKKRKLSKFERTAIVGFIVMLLLMIIKFVR